MCELPLIFAGIGQAVCRWIALSLGSLKMQFQQDWPKDYKNYSSLIFLQENLENFHAKICNFSKIGDKIEK